MRDLRNEFIQQTKLALTNILGDSELEQTTAAIISILDKYELTERSTELIPFNDGNEKIIKMYAGCIIVEGKSKNTVAAYLRELKKFIRFIGNKDIKETTAFDIRNYLAQEKVRGVSNRTVENSRANLSAFFAWLSAEEYIDKNPCLSVKTIKYTEEVKQPFSAVELDLLRSSCKNEKERTLIELLVSSGVRVSELVELDVTDIDFDRKIVHVRHGKGDKERYTYMNDVAKAHLIKYLTENKIECGSIFRSKRRERYTTHGIRELLNVIAKRAGVTNVHPHRFRRTFATTLASRGMDIQNIQSLMGHVNINTTMVYVTLDNTAINNSYLKYAV